MSALSDHLLTLIVFLPSVGALLLLAFPRSGAGARGLALTVALLGLGLSAWGWARFDPAHTSMQLTESLEWIPTFGIRYSVGVDGVSLLLVMLTTFLWPVVILSTYSSVKDHAREYSICLLSLQTAVLGAFVATDLFLFYVFSELVLVPMAFLIGLWGGPRRIYASSKLFLYGLGGSLLMLVAILYTVWAVRDAGGLTFDVVEITRRLRQIDLGEAEPWLFLAFALAFAVKVPLFPFHTWLPDAHVEAPTGGSVVLACVLLKLGTYGLLRFALFMFPKAALVFLPALGTLAVIGILYGALVAMVQTDLDRLVAYATVSQLGLVVLGLTAMTVSGVVGGVLHMVNHGISTAGLFLLVGVLHERRQTRELEAFGGLASVMPRYAFTFVLLGLSAAGLPGLNGFVGELMILLGTYSSRGVVIDATTGELATFVCALAGALGVGAVILVTIAVGKNDGPRRYGAGTRAAATGVTSLLAAALLLPPVNEFQGGLLLRPLNDYVLATEGFGEVFALFAVLAALGGILAAVYLLRATQRLFFRPLRYDENRQLRDLSPREVLVFLPLIVAAVGCGLYPQPLIAVIEPTAEHYAREFRSAADLPLEPFESGR